MCVATRYAGGGKITEGFQPGSFLAPGTYTGFGGTTVNIVTIAPKGLPEPSSLLLLGSGIVGLLGAVRRKLSA